MSVNKTFNDKEMYISHFKSVNEIFIFLKKNPIWLSGFACGEGCFTGYLSLDLKSLWGLQPGLDFNITQSTNDKILLEAINFYFDNKGGVYNKPNNVSVVAFRNVKVLKEIIIPFFYEYPLVGIKSYELERWIKLVDILYTKKHLGKNFSNKNNILNFAEISKELNIKRVNKNKLERINIIIGWLKNLESLPSMEDKFNLIKLIENNSNNI
jgi:LAGLIDADG endonuclease